MISMTFNPRRLQAVTEAWRDNTIENVDYRYEAALEVARYFVDIDIYFYQNPHGGDDGHTLLTRDFKYYVKEHFGLDIEQWQAVDMLEEELRRQLEVIREDYEKHINLEFRNEY